MTLQLFAIPFQPSFDWDYADEYQIASEIWESAQQLYRIADYCPPWTCYFAVEGNRVVGTCGFKSPPINSQVEIAYYTFPGNEGRGIATSMAGMLAQIAATTDPKVAVRAETLIDRNASHRILEKLDFVQTGFAEDDEVGKVISWQQLRYAVNQEITVEQFRDLLVRSTLGARRPVDQPTTLQTMLKQADVTVTVWLGSKLIGVSRALTDFVYCTYLSDLAVDECYQRKGIGKRLIELTHQHAGLQTNLILLAAPAARDYYPHIGFERHDSCWIRPKRN